MRILKFLENNFEKIERIYMRVAVILIILCLIIIFPIMIINGIENLKKAPFKCIENNLYINGKTHKLINQNKKCIVINKTIYIRENGNLERAY